MLLNFTCLTLRLSMWRGINKKLSHDVSWIGYIFFNLICFTLLSLENYEKKLHLLTTLLFFLWFNLLHIFIEIIDVNFKFKKRKKKRNFHFVEVQNIFLSKKMFFVIYCLYFFTLFIIFTRKKIIDFLMVFNIGKFMCILLLIFFFKWKLKNCILHDSQILCNILCVFYIKFNFKCIYY